MVRGKDYTGTTLLVYYDQLRLLLARCPRCGPLNDPTEEKIFERDGSQFRTNLKCLQVGCLISWISQPRCKSFKGFDLDLTSAIFMSDLHFYSFVYNLVVTGADEAKSKGCSIKFSDSLCLVT